LIGNENNCDLCWYSIDMAYYQRRNATCPDKQATRIDRVDGIRGVFLNKRKVKLKQKYHLIRVLFSSNWISLHCVIHWKESYNY